VGEPTPRRTWTVWSVTWLSYATYYFGRKNLSVTKASIGRALGSHALYGVETAYLAAYAIGQYGSGWLGDRVGARKLVGLGMLIAAGASFAFGLWSVGALFLATATLNGLAQSTGWPGNVKAMQEWTTPERRGRVMGVWATCYQVGGIAATAFAAWMLARGGWRAAYFGAGAVIAVVGLMVLALVPSRRVVAGPGAGEPGYGEMRDNAKPPDGAPALEEVERDRVARRAVALSATVWWYGASYFFIKLIRYSLLFWLPFYLETVLRYAPAQAAYYSTSFEIGGVAGTIALGTLSDRLPRTPRSLVCSVSLVGLALALFVYSRVG
jgi:sugar phosphate permease